MQANQRKETGTENPVCSFVFHGRGMLARDQNFEVNLIVFVALLDGFIFQRVKNESERVVLCLFLSFNLPGVPVSPWN